MACILLSTFIIGSSNTSSDSIPSVGLRQLGCGTSASATEGGVLDLKSAVALAKSTAVDEFVEQKTARRSGWCIVSAFTPVGDSNANNIKLEAVSNKFGVSLLLPWGKHACC